MRFSRCTYRGNAMDPRALVATHDFFNSDPGSPKSYLRLSLHLAKELPVSQSDAEEIIEALIEGFYVFENRLKEGERHLTAGSNLDSVVLKTMGIPVQASPTARRKSRSHVLYIENEVMESQLVQRAFAQSGLDAEIHSVLSAYDAMLFLNRLLHFNDAPTPRLILLDLNLPTFDGRDLLELLKRHRRFREIPVVIVSGMDSEVDRKRCKDLGVADFIIKPSTFVELVELLKSLDRWFANSDVIRGIRL